MKYLVAFTSDSHHLMNESNFYTKIYSVESTNISDIIVEKFQRQFSLEFKVPLIEVHHLWTCRIKE